MPDGSDLAYDSDGLRRGASGLSAARDTVDAATAKLQAARLAPAMFGRTPGAGGFAGAVGAARAAQAGGFRRESERAGDLSGRAGVTGDMGDGLTAGTTGIAAAVSPARAQ